MPILFGILSFLVLATSLWTTYKNKTEFSRQIDFRRTEEVNYKDAQDQYKKRVKELEDETAQRDSLIAENEELSESLKGVLTDIEDLEDEIASKQRKIKSLESDVEEANESLKDLPDKDTLVPKIKRLRNDIAQLKDDIDKEEVKLANLKQVKKTTEGVINVEVGEAEKIAEGKSQDRLKTSIKTVYSSWGFVTLNGGDIQGVVPGSKLDVVRGGEVVAKLKVTSVEPNRAAADIIRESIEDGGFIQSGDTVRAEGVSSVVTKVKKAKQVSKPKAVEAIENQLDPDGVELDDDAAFGADDDNGLGDQL